MSASVMRDGARLGAAAPPGAGPPPRLAMVVPDFDTGLLQLAWPAEGPVISTFGHRRSGWHGGIDIKAPLGTPVQAAAAGVVVTAGVEARYGLVVKIEHKQGFVTVYAHNDVNLVEVGDRVDAGELIALVGNTGRATTYHVHFEVRRDGLAYNPLYLLPMPPRIAQIEETADRPHECGGRATRPGRATRHARRRGGPRRPRGNACDEPREPQSLLEGNHDDPAAHTGARRRAGPTRARGRRGRQGAPHRGEPEARRADRAPVPKSWSPAAGPDRGGQHRPPARRREIRRRAWHALLDVRDLVDSPSDRAGARESGSD